MGQASVASDWRMARRAGSSSRSTTGKAARGGWSLEWGSARHVASQSWIRMAPLRGLKNARVSPFLGGGARKCGARSNWSLRPSRCEKNTRFSGRRIGPIVETRHILYVARSRSPTLESARWAPTSLEPGMNVLFARARARESQLGLTTSMESEKPGRTARGMGGRCATKFRRILSCDGRGTGLDRGEGEFSSFHPRDHGPVRWRYPLWLSAFAYGFKALWPAVGGGSRQRAKWDFFGGKSSHLVPYSSIHFYLF